VARCRQRNGVDDVLQATPIRWCDHREHFIHCALGVFADPPSDAGTRELGSDRQRQRFVGLTGGNW